MPQVQGMHSRSTPQSERRVREIKRQLIRGEYEMPSPEQIADAILSQPVDTLRSDFRFFSIRQHPMRHPTATHIVARS